MTNETLKRANELSKKIEETKDYIKTAKLTQSAEWSNRPMYIEFLGSGNALYAPQSLFRLIGKLILNEHQQYLNELETEFNNL